MKALVTGGAGSSDRTLSERLLDHGAEVTALDCFTDYYPRPIKERNIAGLRGRAGLPLRGDAASPTPTCRRCSTASRTCSTSPRRPACARAGDAISRSTPSSTWTRRRRLLEACVGRPIERVVYASSSSVYGDEASLPMREELTLQPVSPYGVTKLAAEQLCHLYFVNHGVPTVSLRYFTVYGPRQRPDMGFNRFFIARLLDGRPVMQYGDGLQTRDFTFVADAVSATAAAVRGVPGARLQYWWGFPRLAAGGVRDDRPCLRPRGPHRAPARPEGRHARHLRGHDARAGRPRLCAVGDARGRAARDVSLDGSDQSMSYGWKRLLIARRWFSAPRPAARSRRALPPGSAEADKFLFERGQEAVKNEEMGERAGIFPQYRRQLPAEPVSARRQAGAR